jgi:hypothetical protein
LEHASLYAAAPAIPDEHAPTSVLSNVEIGAPGAFVPPPNLKRGSPSPRDDAVAADESRDRKGI